MALSSRSAAGGRGRPRLGRSSCCGLLGWGALGEALGEARGPEGDGLGTPLRGAPVRASTGASGPWTIRASLWGWHVAEATLTAAWLPPPSATREPACPQGPAGHGKSGDEPPSFHLFPLKLSKYYPRSSQSPGLPGPGAGAVGGERKPRPGLHRACVPPDHPRSSPGPAGRTQRGVEAAHQRPPSAHRPLWLDTGWLRGPVLAPTLSQDGTWGASARPTAPGLPGGVRERHPPPGWSRSPLKEPFSVAGGCGGSPLPAWCPALPLAPPGRAATALMLL